MSDLPPTPQTVITPHVTEELPDTSMFWRRILTFSVNAIVFILIYWISARTHKEMTLHDEFKLVLGYSLILSLTYFTGANLNDWVSMVTALRTKRTILMNGQDLNR